LIQLYFVVPQRIFSHPAHVHAAQSEIDRALR
jgi:hypothetical protein